MGQLLGGSQFRSPAFDLARILLHHLVETRPADLAAVRGFLWKPNQRPVRHGEGSEDASVLRDDEGDIGLGECALRNAERDIMLGHRVLRVGGELRRDRLALG